jgi:terminase, large subunit
MTTTPPRSGFLDLLLAQALTPPDRRPIAEWIAEHRHLPRGSAYEGPKRVELTPALRPIYEWFRDPYVREITILKSAQIGYTDAMVDIVLWVAVNDPSPMAFYFADQETARKMMFARIRPALDHAGLIRRRTGEKVQEATSFEIRLGNGFHLVVSWASSVAATASMSYKYIIADEVDKPGYLVSGQEGGVIGRIRERAETYPDSKIIWGSTPTVDSGLITREFGASDAQFDYHVACPHCQHRQTLRFFPAKIDDQETGSVTWPDGSHATKVQVHEESAYACGKCGALWTTEQKNDALKHGGPVARAGAPARPRTIGYQINRLMSLFPGGRLDALVSSWLRSRTDIGEMQNFYNSTLGEAWVQRVSAGQDEAQQAIMECKTTLPKATVPDEAVALTCGIDVQQKGFWYRVRAWGEDTTSWGIDEGFLPAWEDVETLLFSSYAQHSGQRLPIWRALIDTGGGKEDGAYISRTEETYNFIRQHQGRGVVLFGSKGSSRTMPTKIRIGKPIEKTPSGKPIPGGIQIVMVNTPAVKDAIEARIRQTRTDGGPGSWYIHADTPDWYAKQVTAEERRLDRKTKIVEWIQIRRDNHILDCEVMCYVLADPEFHGGLRPLITLNRRASHVSAPAAQAPAASKEPANPAIRRY